MNSDDGEVSLFTSAIQASLQGDVQAQQFLEELVRLAPSAATVEQVRKVMMMVIMIMMMMMMMMMMMLMMIFDNHGGDNDNGGGIMMR